MAADPEIMQELYESGLDASIACMAGAGFLVELELMEQRLMLPMPDLTLKPPSGSRKRR